MTYYPSPDTEGELVESPAISYFAALGWETIDAYGEFSDPSTSSTLGRETKAAVVLTSRLRSVLERLNPDLPPIAIDHAIEELTRSRSAMSLAHANREIYDLLKGGVSVKISDPETGGDLHDTVRVIDWNEPENNDFLLVSQLTVTGDMATRRPDLVGFVNGLPLVFVELKTTGVRLESAYRVNLAEYKNVIPHLFWYNALIVLSNGLRTRIGSLTAPFGHFAGWPKIASEDEPGSESLETALRATCEPSRLLDLVENYTIFQEGRRGLAKIVAKNHQFLGVENTIESLHGFREKDGRLGVFWHTQGSGKSVSMIFFAQKVLRKVPGNWTFVVITDRIDLDDQIYENFARAGVVTEKKAHATSSEHLRQLLKEDHRYVFTLIQKFRTPRGVKHEVLSRRDDIVVITDEAHRSQYDTLAMNLRTALPNASFLAFTGTPLLAGEEKTRKVFGDYVSIYNFKQSVDDGATVPLYYENRIPELQLTNENLDEDMERLLEEAELDDAQEERLEREFGRQYHLITRDDRLEKIAEDIVDHFFSRGFLGKAMVVSIDKATTVKMYDKVRKHWQREVESLTEKLPTLPDDERRPLERKLTFMEETDMAVVVSYSQGETVKMKDKGVDIVPHRERMEREDLESKFKDEDDDFRIVFVCAMWMTGFDVQSCSTIYLDKPMRNHTLMQTIARANRVFPEKENGLIVDYVGVFRDLQRALAIYGSDAGGGVKPGESPVEDKSALVAQLREAIAETGSFLAEHGIDLNAIDRARRGERLRLREQAVDTIVAVENRKQAYLAHARQVGKLYRAVLPDPVSNKHMPRCALIGSLVNDIRALNPPADIYEVMSDVETLLDRSVAAEAYVIRERPDERVDLSRLDFEALRQRFKTGWKHIETEKLKSAIHRKLERMVRRNPSRRDFLLRFQRLIDAYNASAMNIEELFRALVELGQSLNEEEQRAIREMLSEEELAVFDILTRPDMKLSRKEEAQVKKVARELLATLKDGKLVLDWRQRQQSRAQVELTIKDVLDRGLPEVYTPELYDRKCGLVYQHVFDSYFGSGSSIYQAGA